MLLVWPMLICYSIWNGRQGLGQRENALNTAKDLRVGPWWFLGFLLSPTSFLMSALLFSTIPRGWTGKRMVV